MTKCRRSVTDNFTAEPIGSKTYQSRRLQFLSHAHERYFLCLPSVQVHTPTRFTLSAVAD